MTESRSGDGPEQRPWAPDAATRARHSGYWRRNLRYVAILLFIWFAQQGSIYVFVILIFVYVLLMNRLDRAYDVDERSGP